MLASQAVRARAAEAGCPRWEPQDLLFLGYLGLVVALLLVFGVGLGHVERPWSLIAYHLLIGVVGVGACWLAATWRHPFVRFVRWWYPAFLFTFCFEAVGHMIYLVQPQLIDTHLAAADQFLFGAALTPLFQQYARPWLTELMYVCYSSYYFLVPAIGLPLYFRTRNRETGEPGLPFRQLMVGVSLTFWVCYLHFLITPAGGPVFWPNYSGPIQELHGGPITAAEEWVFNHGTIVGGAFPSSHVAVALVVASYAVRFSVVPLLFVPLFIGLALSPIYAGYHYGVDVIYGMAIGVITFLLTAKPFDKLGLIDGVPRWHPWSRLVRSKPMG